MKKSRKLVFPTTDPAVGVLIIRATDVPTYVEYGGADLGVTGKDVLMEHGGAGLYEPLDLNISRCRLMTAGPKGETPPPAASAWPPSSSTWRAAITRPKAARRISSSCTARWNWLRFWGWRMKSWILSIPATPSRPMVWSPDLIENISSRLVVNRASMKMKHGQLNPITVEQMAAAVERRRQG